MTVATDHHEKREGGIPWHLWWGKILYIILAAWVFQRLDWEILWTTSDFACCLAKRRRKRKCSILWMMGQYGKKEEKTCFVRSKAENNKNQSVVILSNRPKVEEERTLISSLFAHCIPNACLKRQNIGKPQRQKNI